jgi:hypothetical protein
MRHLSLMLLTIGLLQACSSGTAPTPLASGILSSVGEEPVSTDEFNAYWYSGQAEITTYTLEQARYGGTHPGKSILVFVTEDFNTDKQVKRELTTGDSYTSVLKLNKIDRFITGIYDYSLMLSTFTPIRSDDHPHCLKTTLTAQDWCGQSTMQLNKQDIGYRAQIRSYFEMEGDMDVDLGEAVLEDEIWTHARLNPTALPQGDFDLIPSSAHLRLRHQAVEVVKAKGRLVIEAMSDASERYVYKVDFPDGRHWELYIQSVFPYRIQGWEMQVPKGDQILTTRAEADRSIKSAYWGQNEPNARVLRERLGLDVGSE